MGNTSFKRSENGDDSNGEQASDEILEIDQPQEESEANGVIFTTCEKDPEHEDYFAVNNLTIDNLPQDIATQHVLDHIMAHVGLVVRVVNMTPGKEKTATGYVWLYDSESNGYKCTLNQCDIEIPHNVFGGILVTTNKHVILNKEEACHTNVQFFYHTLSEKENPENKGRGYDLKMNSENKDLVGLKVVIHERSVIDSLRKRSRDVVETWNKIPNEVKKTLKSYAIVISHPHGEPKVISFGKLKQLEKPDTKTEGRLITGYTTSTCKGSSGAPVLTGYYDNRPFVHSSKLSRVKLNVSYSY